MRIKTLAVVSLLFWNIVLAGQATKLEMSKKESSITYKMVHPLHEIEATSKEADLQVEANPSKKEIESVSARVDVMTFDSGNSNRDSHAMEVIDAITYPEVTFVSSSITRAGDSLKVTGKLTFHGITQDVVSMVLPQWKSDKLEVRGGFVLSLTAFKIERPSLLMIPVEDALRFAFVAVFQLQ